MIKIADPKRTFSPSVYKKFERSQRLTMEYNLVDELRLLNQKIAPVLCNKHGRFHDNSCYVCNRPKDGQRPGKIRAVTGLIEAELGVVSASLEVQLKK